MDLEVAPVIADQFDEVYPLLQDFADPRMSREDWDRMLFHLPWPVEEEHRGYVLRERGTVVGFMGTIFSRRSVRGTLHRFCNLSSWIVKESHRGSSLQLLRPVLALESHTILALTSSAAAQAVYLRFGFKPLESAQVLLPPFARPTEVLHVPWASVTTRLEAMRARLGESGRRVLEDMAGTLASQAVVSRGGRHCHVVATRSPWKGRWRLAHVQYASDWELFWEQPGSVSAAFSRTLGTVGLRVDSRHLAGPRPPLSVHRALPRARLYRPARPDLAATDIDGLYTELVGQRW